MIPHALHVRTHYLEVGVVLGLQWAFAKRLQRYPTRATYAILSAYGKVALTNNLHHTKEAQLHLDSNAA